MGFFPCPVRPGVGCIFVSPAWIRLLVGRVVLLYINHRELLAVERGLSHLRRFLTGLVVEVFSVNTTTVAYLRHQGGTLSPTFNESAQRGLSLSEASGSPHSSSGTKLSQTPGFVLSPFHQGESPGGGDSGASPQGCGGVCTSFAVLQPYVCGNVGLRRVEADRRLSTLNLLWLCQGFDWRLLSRSSTWCGETTGWRSSI